MQTNSNFLNLQEESAEILDRIKVKQITNHHQLINVLHEVKNDILNGVETKIIIIDSLPAVFYHKGDFNDTLTTMNHFVNVMRYIATQQNVCFVVVNIMLKNQALLSATSATTTEKTALGQYWQTVPNVRLRLAASEDSNCCNITIIKSTNSRCNDCCNVTICEAGVV